MVRAQRADPGAGTVAAFDQEIVLASGEDLTLTHRHVILDRVWDADELAALADELRP